MENITSKILAGTSIVSSIVAIKYKRDCVKARNSAEAVIKKLPRKQLLQLYVSKAYNCDLVPSTNKVNNISMVETIAIPVVSGVALFTLINNVNK